jgi:hypothetical protein
MRALRAVSAIGVRTLGAYTPSFTTMDTDGSQSACVRRARGLRSEARPERRPRAGRTASAPVRRSRLIASHPLAAPAVPGRAPHEGEPHAFGFGHGHARQIRIAPPGTWLAPS